MQIKTSAHEALCTPEGGLGAPVCFDRVWRRVSVAAGTAMLSAALLLAGCSKEPVDGPGDASGKVALDFSVESIGEMLPAAKAALTSNTTVRVIAYSSNDSNPAQANYVADQAYYWNGSKLVPCIVDNNGNKTADAADQVMKLLHDNYDFYAMSPAIPLNADKTTLSTAVNNGVDYAASAKTTVTVPVQATPYELTLNTLQRQCAQVKLVVTNGGYVNPTTLTVNSVKVTGLAAAVSGVTVGSDIAPASSGTQSLSLAGSDFTVSGMTATQKTPSTVLPLNNATLSLEYGLTLEGVQKTVTGSVGVTLEKGKLYTITAQISSESDITLSVEGWTQNSGNNPGFDGTTYPYVVDGKIIVVADKFGAAAGYPLHGPWTETPQHNESAWDANASGINTVSGAFEVASSDAKGKDGRSAAMTWFEASGTTDINYNRGSYSACERYSEASDQSDKNFWRLPTVRELEVISSKINELTSANLPSDNGYYWSATEDSSYGSDFACYVDLFYFYGIPEIFLKRNTNGVRCVRDL